MTPLFDKDTNLVGWLSDDKKNIFDTNTNWVAFVSNDNSVWTGKNKVWVGILYGNNLRDINGKTSFWNPETQVENTLKPLRPLRPLNPLRPLRPLTPLGGWSSLNWEHFINGN